MTDTSVTHVTTPSRTAIRAVTTRAAVAGRWNSRLTSGLVHPVPQCGPQAACGAPVARPPAKCGDGGKAVGSTPTSGTPGVGDYPPSCEGPDHPSADEKT